MSKCQHIITFWYWPSMLNVNPIYCSVINTKQIKKQTFSFVIFSFYCFRSYCDTEGLITCVYAECYLGAVVRPEWHSVIKASPIVLWLWQPDHTSMTSPVLIQRGTATLANHPALLLGHGQVAVFPIIDKTNCYCFCCVKFMLHYDCSFSPWEVVDLGEKNCKFCMYELLGWICNDSDSPAFLIPCILRWPSGLLYCLLFGVPLVKVNKLHHLWLFSQSWYKLTVVQGRVKPNYPDVFLLLVIGSFYL